MRILFTTVGLSGHFFPLVPLAWACRCLGHEVMVATTENAVPEVLRTGLPAYSFGPPGGLADLAASDEGAGPSPAAQRASHGKAFARIAHRNLPGMRKLAQDWRPDLVVSERAELAGPMVALIEDIPRVELHWGVATLCEYHDAARVELSDHPLWTGLGPADLSLSPWPPSLRPAGAIIHQSVRHVSYNGDARLPGWLLTEPERPRICVTLGTVLPHLGSRDVTGFVLPLLERLTVLDAEIVVAVDDRIAAGWPALPPAVAYAGRLPLAQTLATCAATINHGGQGTTLTALAAACPQVVLPQLDDQFDNADAVMKAGAGIRLLPEETNPAAVVRACWEVLGERSYTAAATVTADEIAAQPGPTEIATLLGCLV
jgi:UDP:flavonoid glycosyltransferase YjiC (YdhE family)